jgi:methylenetetrahydrofolate dehydrogenase (NADP+) / methenyltetrahydrofolate cyclohydrolase
MTVQAFDCTHVARRVLDGLDEDVRRLRDAGVGGGLATVLVGDDVVAATEQHRLERLARDVGVSCESVRLAESASDPDVVETVRSLNERAEISAITLLRPLPDCIDESAVRDAVDGHKDVEAAGPENVGLLAMGRPRYVPPTASAAYEVLDAWIASQGYDADDFYRRSRIVVVGGVNEIATSAVLLGCARRAPVASVDPAASGGAQLGWYTRHADVLIVAAGMPALVRAEHVREGAILVDAGSTSIRDEESGEPRIVGDVVLDEVTDRARVLTADPDGLAEVRAAVLMRSVVRAGLSARPSDLRLVQALS